MPFVFRLLILFIMIFCHVVDDYYLQGSLAKMKQSRWWRQNPDCQRRPRLYAKDYMMALFVHSFSWSFVVGLPLLVIACYTENEYLGWIVAISYILNTIIHAFVDNEKANRLSINLIKDQSIHLFQILLLWIVSMGAI